MDKLRHHEADPDDPDDVDSEDSERYVLSRDTRVIMPDERRHVIAGYYAGVVADMCKFCGRLATACADQKSERNTLYFRGSGWSIVLQPLYLRDGNMYWIEHNAIADALTGKLVWSHFADGKCNIRKLRFPHPRPDIIIIDDPQPKEGEVAK